MAEGFGVCSSVYHIFALFDIFPYVINSLMSKIIYICNRWHYYYGLWLKTLYIAEGSLYGSGPYNTVQFL